MSDAPDDAAHGYGALHVKLPSPLLSQPYSSSIPIHLKGPRHTADASLSGCHTQGDSDLQLATHSTVSVSGLTVSKPLVLTAASVSVPRQEPGVDFVGGCQSAPLNADSSSGSDEDGSSSSTIGSHADSFYASLVAAQQLRHQRTAALSTGAASSSTESGGLLSPSSSQPPRTLQDLLAWRQELLETRMKEHTERQQQYWQDSLSNSSSMNASRGIGGTPLPGRCTLLTPMPTSPPFLFAGSRQSSSQFSSAFSPLLPRSADYASPTNSSMTESRGDSVADDALDTPVFPPRDGFVQRERMAVSAPTCLPQMNHREVKRRPPSTPQLRRLQHRVPQTMTTPVAAMEKPLPPCVYAASNAPSRGSSSCGTPVSNVALSMKDEGKEPLGHVRLRAGDAGPSIAILVVLFLVLFLLLSVIFGAPYIPPWFWHVM